ncbi:MAG TPA: DUF2194 domain-containing protein [Spirochaetota bacterium]|nr:DUF2194 domain-containing protein [Spirochaetota bacterium]HOR94146.1 DUF2194 domain-containing protein [Spirochaetota bacterium]HOT19561.1 DUF2194 domain-containing protein [Spirochaetota bacterium]HPD05553.1 DUF2194 domain-containing protein [Spirochaetota bacterium]HRR61316.1 DUF2194 domain-containing protein [Spirochaetota bacterium]
MKLSFIKTIALITVSFCIVIFSTVSSFAKAKGLSVLCIYKSSEGYTDDSNPLKWFFEKDITANGLQVKYYDFDKGFSSLSNLDDIRAIVTWYNGGVVASKDIGINYAKFMIDAANKGIKIIIVNSYGAYGYKDGNETKWDLLPYIRPLFTKIGIYFQGFWTNNPNNIKIIYKDSAMVEKDEKQDVTKSLHYQQIIPLREDVKTYLQLQRTDAPPQAGDGKSSIIVISKTGAFALENYVVRGSKVMLNTSRFIHEALFYDDGYLNVGVIIGDIDRSNVVNNNILYAFKYAKIRCDVYTKEEIKGLVANDLTEYEALLVATKTADAVPLKLLKGYVENGGKCIFLNYVEPDNELNTFIGIKEYIKKEEYFKQGFTLQPSLFLNGVNVPGDDIDCNVRRAVLESDVKVIGTVNTLFDADKYPVVWERTIKKGKILYWNTNLLDKSKLTRGMIVQSIYKIADVFATGMINVGLIMIDDFPAPWWNVAYKPYRIKYYSDLLQNEKDKFNRKKLEEIIEKLKKLPEETDTLFISDVWFKDILAWQKQFGFAYSSFLIFNYNRDTKADETGFAVRDFYLSQNGLSTKMGIAALENGFELGLHGYNHMSLTLTKAKEYDSVPWPDKKTMVQALTVAKNEWIALYGESALPFSYVAPHNIIDATGLQALGEVFPSIRVVSTLYVVKSGGVEQEFDWSPDNRFYQIPRITSGYYFQDFDKFALYDAFQNFGIISHFIHPDDVFDEMRSKSYEGWLWLKSNFEKEFGSLKQNYPWIRWMTVKDAFYEFVVYNSSTVNFKVKGNSIEIYTPGGAGHNYYIRARIPKQYKQLINCNLVQYTPATGDIVVKTNKYKSVIAW